MTLAVAVSALTDLGCYSLTPAQKKSLDLRPSAFLRNELHANWFLMFLRILNIMFFYFAKSQVNWHKYKYRWEYKYQCYCHFMHSNQHTQNYQICLTCFHLPSHRSTDISHSKHVKCCLVKCMHHQSKCWTGISFNHRANNLISFKLDWKAVLSFFM